MTTLQTLQRGLWINGVCLGLGIKVNPEIRAFFFGWWAWEGGGGGIHGAQRTAKFNWLNSTTRALGSTMFNVVPGVQNYITWVSGVYATIKTLRNPRYSGLVHALKDGKPLAAPYAEQVGQGLQVWVSGQLNGNPDYAVRVLASGASFVGKV